MASLGRSPMRKPSSDAKPITFSFEGPFGKFDKAQLQRGYKVYKEVCSNCHAMKLIAFRNLADKGGPGFTEEQVKALASTFNIHDLDDKGEPMDRNGLASDYFPSPFPNEARPKLPMVARCRPTSR